MNIIYNIEDLDDIAKLLVSQAKSNLILFHGDMGVGKTTLIKAILKHLGCNADSKSPTFSIVEEYNCQAGSLVYHMDCYRLENEEEAYEMGLYEYFDEEHLTLIEWPSRISAMLPDSGLNVYLEFVDPDTRKISLK
ncbi:tRNA (adenosine(37)-N6)-threonylcarbamoyltransferase complex ATPase subunit type 1 TsaE [Robiginitalea sediminis]|uniref:tRNA (adenosine(37)-N6)-threonylcarbamoyltransferase complex ATPase subunit type 1 TsaE n=1 Tax=Robiginitalea sediminis TaxID=1982593 RepID=UPI000B4ABA82|nr:tRNA (adenosine(37)-N6)-threonylcarbamoyltransferase complex ATPase subunit type 1 TsaE [Robiginitalea sediminis]